MVGPSSNKTAQTTNQPKPKEKGDKKMYVVIVDNKVVAEYTVGRCLMAMLTAKMLGGRVVRVVSQASR